MALSPYQAPPFRTMDDAQHMNLILNRWGFSLGFNRRRLYLFDTCNRGTNDINRSVTVAVTVTLLSRLALGGLLI
jgi:hypothetical protein